MCSSEEHPAKTKLLIHFRLSGRVMLVKIVQFSKARDSISITGKPL